MLKSSAEILGENSARRLSKKRLKSRNFNQEYVRKYVRLFYNHFLYEMKIIFLIDTENFSAKF